MWCCGRSIFPFKALALECYPNSLCPHRGHPLLVWVAVNHVPCTRHRVCLRVQRRVFVLFLSSGFEVPTCLSQLHVFFRAQPRASVAVLNLLARAVRNCSVDRNSGSEPAWPARPLPGCVILDCLRHFSVLPFPLKYLPLRVLRRIRWFNMCKELRTIPGVH